MTTATALTPSSVVRAYLAVSGLFTPSASATWGVTALFLLDWQRHPISIACYRYG
jgi:hypothetical protein